MSDFHFDVLQEPWIPVIRDNGVLEELGIIDCLVHAHEILRIRDSAPIVEFGLYRMLVAFILDLLETRKKRPNNTLDLKELLKNGHFEKDHLIQYVRECGDVFDLFHPERPFLQTATAGIPKPLAGLYPVTPSGTNALFWFHQDETEMSVSAAEAARLLTTIPPFMTAGGAGLSPSINGAPAIYVLPAGANLFETLIMNLPLQSPMESGEGRVAWRDTSPPGQERTTATMPEALTWKPRIIQLIPESGVMNDIVVKRMYFEKGNATIQNWKDPNLAYKYSKDKVFPVRMQENRLLWRDAGPLALLDDGMKGKDDNAMRFKRPDVVTHAFELTPATDSCDIVVYGIRTDLKMKFFEWAQSSWRVPAHLGRSTLLGSVVHKLIERAGDASYRLNKSILMLFPREGKGNAKALGTLADRAERRYWQGMEAEFPILLSTFSALTEDAVEDDNLMASSAEPWLSAIRSHAIECFEAVASDMDSNGEALRRLVKARSVLHSQLKKVLS